MRNIFLSIPKRLSPWLPAIVVIAFAIIYACCFTSIYAKPHTYTAASLWIYKNIPAGARLAEPHWDDRLPLDLPGKWAGQYKYAELPLYEADTPQKMEKVAGMIAESDYIILPTQRLQGSIPRVPNEFKQTTRLFQLLFSGQLGYRLVKTVKQRPLLSRWFFDDDLADESFSVYDHPKASIFKNAERLSRAELQRRMVEGGPAGVLPDLPEMLSADSHVTKAVAGQAADLPIWLQVVLWLAVFEIFAVCFFPFCASALPHSADGGYGAARASGLLLTGITGWLLADLKLLSLNGSNFWLITLSFLLLADLFCRRVFGSWRELFTAFSPGIRRSLALWYGIFGLFALLRAFQPEIFWGEKPMDFSFLNYFTRAERMPPEDPWAAGFSMQYYYLGPLLMAVVHKMSFISTAVGYNLSLVTIAALIAVVSFTLFSTLGLNIRSSILSALGLLLLSNLEVLNIVSFGKRNLDFDLFWAATRLFTSPSFAEYPLWSFLFGDLHAHVIAVPFVLLIFVFTASVVKPRRFGAGFLLSRFLTGVIFGALVGLNTWDCITLGVWLLVVFLALTFPYVTSTWEGRGFFGSLLVDGLAALAGLLCIAPAYFSSSARNAHAGIGWVQKFELNNASQLLRHFGLWFFVIIFTAVVLLTAGRRDLKESWRASHPAKLIALLLPLIPLLFAGYVKWKSGVPAPPGILALATLLIASGVVFLMQNRNKAALRFAGTLVVAAGLLLIFAELVFLNDRMNTIFKLYNTLWLMFGIAALVSAGTLLELSRRPKETEPQSEDCAPLFSRWLSRFGVLCAALLFLAAAGGSAINIYIMTTFQRVSGPRPTLDGEAYLGSAALDRNELAGYQWIREHVSGTPVMLEAQGESYQDFSRVVMHTGIPVVLGWEYHVLQRGLPATELFQRRFDVKTIYETGSVDRALALLRKYNVQLIVVGDRERRSYPSAGLQKFENYPGVFFRLFKAGSFSLYAPFYSELARLAPPPSAGVNSLQ